MAVVSAPRSVSHRRPSTSLSSPIIISILRLFFLHDLPGRQIADSVGLSQSTVNRLLQRRRISFPADDPVFCPVCNKAIYYWPCCACEARGVEIEKTIPVLIENNKLKNHLRHPKTLQTIPH